MADRERQWLIKAIQKLLKPEFERRGFEVIPLTAKESRGGELRAAFPCGRLRRLGPDGFEMVEIQMDKHGRAAFRLNLGIAPPGGIEHAAGHVLQEDIWVHYLNQYYEFYQCPLIRRWFSLWHWPGKLITETDYEELVKTVVKLIPEIEQMFREGRLGPHMRQVK